MSLAPIGPKTSLLQKILEKVLFVVVAISDLFTKFLGAVGVVLILYSITAAFKGGWPPVEMAAAFFTSLLTILGTLITAVSIYLPQQAGRTAEGLSLYIVAPTVILSSAVAILFLILHRELPPVLVSGFGLLAISGGLQRLLPGIGWWKQRAKRSPGQGETLPPN